MFDIVIFFIHIIILRGLTYYKRVLVLFMNKKCSLLFNLLFATESQGTISAHFRDQHGGKSQSTLNHA